MGVGRLSRGIEAGGWAVNVAGEARRSRGLTVSGVRFRYWIGACIMVERGEAIDWNFIWRVTENNLRRRLTIQLWRYR